MLLGLRSPGPEPLKSSRHEPHVFIAGVLLCAVGAAARTQLALDFQRASNGNKVPGGGASAASADELSPAQQRLTQPSGATADDRPIQKEYLALIDGHPAADEGIVQVLSAARVRAHLS